MCGFKEYNPIVLMIYFLCTAGVAMFFMHPVILVLSMIGAFLLFFKIDKERNAKTHFLFLLLFIVTALINPMTYHNGVTVLFVVNDAPITLESVVYGIFAGVMIISVIYWFRSFSLIMTSDKLLYVFGGLSPKLSLVLSMALRYVPLMSRQSERVRNAQKTLGFYKSDSIADCTKGGIRVFSVMVTWALENGIITADSMTARGYGTGKRTHFSLFRFRKGDVLFLIITFLLFSGTIVCAVTGNVRYDFYPAMTETQTDFYSLTAYVCYGLLSVMPFIIEVKETIKWKFLMSKI